MYIKENKSPKDNSVNNNNNKKKEDKPLTFLDLDRERTREDADKKK